MLGSCRLCQAQADLQLSHVIPAFVFRWLKKDGFIRHSREINRRTQDGPKFEWLCSSCEAQFNVWETQFANGVFRPIVKGSHTCSYGDWLLKFCVSVSWRTLLYASEQSLQGHLAPEQLVCANDALKVWGEFLRGERPNPGNFEQHLLPLGAIESASSRVDLPPNINRYFLRAIQVDIASSHSTTFTFSKLGSVAIVGFIKVAKPKQWVGTKVKVRHGLIRPRQYELPYPFADYLLGLAKSAWDAMGQMSEAQRHKVDETIRANIDKFAQSEVFKAIQLDAEMFGHAAFRNLGGSDKDAT